MKIIKNDLLPVKVAIAVREKHEDVIKKLGPEWAGMRPFDETHDGEMVHGPGMDTVLIQFLTLTPGVIAHECVHAANAVMKEMGVIADVDNDEFQAYLVEWIVTNVWDEVQRYKKDNPEAKDTV